MPIQHPTSTADQLAAAVMQQIACQARESPISSPARYAVTRRRAPLPRLQVPCRSWPSCFSAT